MVLHFKRVEITENEYFSSSNKSVFSIKQSEGELKLVPRPMQSYEMAH